MYDGRKPKAQIVEIVIFDSFEKLQNALKDGIQLCVSSFDFLLFSDLFVFVSFVLRFVFFC